MGSPFSPELSGNYLTIHSTGFLSDRKHDGVFVAFRPPIGQWFSNGASVNQVQIKNNGDGTYILYWQPYHWTRDGAVSRRVNYPPDKLSYLWYDSYGMFGSNNIADIKNTSSPETGGWNSVNVTGGAGVPSGDTPYGGPAPAPAPGASPPVIVTEIGPTPKPAPTPMPASEYGGAQFLQFSQGGQPLITSENGGDNSQSKFPWWILLLIAAGISLTS